MELSPLCSVITETMCTYAHSDIALSFASWISPEFQLYIMKDYRRLKTDENSRLSLNWNLNREIAKLNYRIHTDAIKDHLIPPELTPEQISYKYANEADMLNVVLFGKTAKQWREENPGNKGNIRDEAELNQLLVLANMESYNAILATQAIPEMIEIATNGVFEENRKAKHGRDAKNGWYRYDTRFALPVYGDDGNIERYNIFRGRLLIRHASSGKKYLYDILEIKKETGKSCQTEVLPGENPFLN